MVSTQKFQDIQVPTPGFGAMSFSLPQKLENDEDGIAVLKRAYDLGCRFWDSAVVYGLGHNESLIGKFFKQYPGTRENVFIASKCGFDVDVEKQTNGGVTNKASHILSTIEGTIERLGSPPDLYYLHRMDPNTPVEESIPALQSLKDQGKTRFIGLSEPGPATLRKACQIAHIDAIQIELSPFFVDHEKNGLIDTAKEFGVTIIAYSPLGKGILTGKVKTEEQLKSPIRGDRFSGENFANNMKLVDKFEELAAKKGCTPGQLSIAWVNSTGAIPIPGTKTISRLEENFGATNVSLSEEEAKEIRDIIEAAGLKGERYSPAYAKMVGV